MLVIPAQALEGILTSSYNSHLIAVTVKVLCCSVFEDQNSKPQGRENRSRSVFALYYLQRKRRVTYCYSPALYWIWANDIIALIETERNN